MLKSSTPSVCIAVLTTLFVLSDLVLGVVDPRISELRDLQSSRPDKVIRLNDESFQKYFWSKEPRSYSLVVFFDAIQLHKNADLQLPELRGEFGLAAKAHVNRFSGSGQGSNLFFCDVEFSQSQNVFKKLSVSALPHVKFIPSGQGTGLKTMNLNEYGRSAEAFVSYLKSVASIDIGPIERPPLISKFTIWMISPLFLASLAVIIRWIFTRQTIFHDSRLWCAGALFIYFFSVSGGMHNIIRGMPMFVRDRQDPSKFVYFFQGSSTQLGVEGFTVGALYTVVGLLLGFATHYLPTVKNTALQRVYMLMCIICSTLAVRQVVSLNQWKTGYHIHAYWPKGWQ